MKNILSAVAVAALLVTAATPVFAADEATESAPVAMEAMEAAPAEEVALVDVVDTAIANPDFSTLVSALQAAELVDALKAEGPFTVFAPTNEAFAALPEGTLEDLLKPENKDKLAAILKNHVVSGKIAAADIAEGKTEVEALEGKLEVEKTADGVTVNGAKVVAADVATTNGVIHVIDTVIVK